MPLPRHQVLIQIVAAVPSRLSLYSDEPMPFSAVEPQHRHSIDFVTLFGRGHCNTVRHGSRNTPDGNAGREPGRRSGAGLGGTSPTPLPLGPDPARHARFNVIHGVGRAGLASGFLAPDELAFSTNRAGGACEEQRRGFGQGGPWRCPAHGA